jgi:TonB family protein
LKPANVLVVGEQLKLSLDSICRTGVLESPGKEGGPYDAPELSREGFTPASDVWSFAVTVTEALTQRLPIWTDRLRTEPTLPSNVPAPFAEIAAHCLRRDSASRWTVPQISARLDQKGIKPALGKAGKPRSIAIPKLPKIQLPKLPRFPKFPKLQMLKPAGNWAYAVGMIAIIGIAILVASMLRPKSESKPGSASAAPPVIVKKPSPNPEKPRTARASVASNPANSAEIVRQTMPEVSERALRTIHGKVRVTVRLHVDSSGNVARAEFVSSGPSRYFAGRALEAAHDWKFVANNRAGVWTLQFVFERGGASVYPKQVS